MKVKDLLSIKDEINLNPQWQRGPVWSLPRRALLIDSILRDMDIPKLYLLRCSPGTAFTFEAVDGQQRLRAVFDFADDRLTLYHTNDLPPVNGIDIEGKTISSLDKRLVKRFREFKISVAEIISADHDQVRQLFLRLQMGIVLNSAELRNAISGPIRDMIDSMALSHSFFDESKINSSRYRYQDYLAHIFTYIDHSGATDLKAANIRTLYEKYDEHQTSRVLDLVSEVRQALDVLSEINGYTNYKITQKWIFVDLLWFIYSRQRKGETVNANIVAGKYEEFEDRRKKYIRHSELLLDDSRDDAEPWDEDLYSYIQAFRTSGGDRENLEIRRAAIQKILG